MSAVPFSVGDKVSPANFLNRTPQMLAEIEATSGSLADFDFTGISQDFRVLRFELLGRSTAVGASVFIRVQVNGLTTSIYRTQYHRGVGSTTEAAAETAASSALGGVAAGDDTVTFGISTITIPHYSRSHPQMIEASGGALPGTSSGSYRAQHSVSRVAASAAVSRVRIFPSSGSWAEGSVVTMYGYP